MHCFHAWNRPKETFCYWMKTFVGKSIQYVSCLLSRDIWSALRCCLHMCGSRRARGPKIHVGLQLKDSRETFCFLTLVFPHSTVNLVSGPSQNPKPLHATKRLSQCFSARKSSELRTIRVRSVQVLLWAWEHWAFVQAHFTTNCSTPALCWARTAPGGGGFEGVGDGVTEHEGGFVQREEQILLCFIQSSSHGQMCFILSRAWRKEGEKEGGGMGGGGACGFFCMKCINGRDGYSPPDRKTRNPVTWANMESFHSEAPAGTHRWRKRERDG